MVSRGWTFKYDSKFNNAPANSLFDRIKVSRQSEGVARNFGDYTVRVDEQSLPPGVALYRRVK